MNRFAFCLVLFFGCLDRLSATHIVGGELTYKCLGDNQYEITLTVYRDCYTGVPPFDNPASVGIYSADWQLKEELKLPYSGHSDTLPIILTNPCLTVPPNVCVHRTSYKSVVTLPFSPGGYTIVYQRCCRNQLIRNIIGPLRTGISIVAVISEEALQACNNGAVFNQWPPVAICIHQPINFDHSATDADGDSLVYRLCTPLQGADSLKPIPQPPNPGPYEEVVWRDPPYNLSNVLGGEPLTIDPATGFLTGVPNLIGNFVVGVCVDEYRDDKLISTVRRDFQYNVADCGQPIAAFFVPEVLCDTLTVKFHNQGLQTHTYKWFFDWGGNKGLTSTLYSPVYTFPDTGVYVVALIAQSFEPCRDTTFKTIHVTRTYANADLEFVFPHCDENGLVVQANDMSIDPQFGIAGWQWTLSGPSGFAAQSSEQNPSFTVTTPGDYLLKLVATSGNGCKDTVTLPFNAPIPPLYLFRDSVTICRGDSIRLLPGADGSFMYAWSPAQALSDTTAPNPLAFPSNTTTYNVTVSGNGPCVVEKEVKVIVLDSASLMATATPATIFVGGSSQLEAMSPGVQNFTWAPPGTLNNPNIPNPVAMPLSSTQYIVTTKLTSGCVLRDTVAVIVRSINCGEPFVFFPTGFSPNGDNENDVLKLESIFVTEVYWVIFNRWGEKIFEANSLDDAWDGTFRGQPQPSEAYGYYLRVRCLDGAEFVKKGNVTLLR